MTPIAFVVPDVISPCAMVTLTVLTVAVVLVVLAAVRFGFRRAFVSVVAIASLLFLLTGVLYAQGPKPRPKPTDDGPFPFKCSECIETWGCLICWLHTYGGCDCEEQN